MNGMARTAGMAGGSPTDEPSAAVAARGEAGQDAEAPGPMVLLVEDNEDNRVIYATYLTHVGYRVLTAPDAETGLELARTQGPDVIVMDVGLPGMDGNAATRRLKADPVTRHIPVIALTAHVHAEDRARSLDAGCDHFLTKPLEPRELGAELRRLVRAGTGPDRTVQEVTAPSPADASSDARPEAPNTAHA